MFSICNLKFSSSNSYPTKANIQYAINKTKMCIKKEGEYCQLKYKLNCGLQCIFLKVAEQLYNRKLAPNEKVVKGDQKKKKKKIYWYCHIHNASHDRYSSARQWNLRKCVLNL